MSLGQSVMGLPATFSCDTDCQARVLSCKYHSLSLYMPRQAAARTELSMPAMGVLLAEDNHWLQMASVPLPKSQVNRMVGVASAHNTSSKEAGFSS